MRQEDRAAVCVRGELAAYQVIKVKSWGHMICWDYQLFRKDVFISI